MKRTSVSALACVAVLLAATVAPAHADPVPGWYLDAGVIGNQTIDSNAKFAGNENVIQYNPGWGLAGGGGYAFNNGFRLEGEVAQIRAGVDKIKGGTGGHGELVDTDFTANLMYDFHTGTLLTPYVGAGLGLALSNADSIGSLSNGGVMRDDQMVFVYQVIAGVAAQLDNHWAITADYRWISTSDPRFLTTNSPATTIDNGSHNIMLGVRYSFGHPMAPAPKPVEPPMVHPAAAPKPVVAPVAQSYMVFFDFNRYDLTPEAKRILASAAQDFGKGGYVKIVVTGHTDTVGTVKYNLALSERRAQAVKAELERLGVAPDAVATNGVGKNGLLVPTANGVREAQNRRAEIIFDKQ
ncbi:MAG: OmpA family protein [Pseudomonadota bacterium]|nr:OmpA family protein [Pseudomonadota bacterium]